MDYSIVRRTENIPDGLPTTLDYGYLPDLNYEKPMLGCSNLEDDLIVGDIIGIKLNKISSKKIDIIDRNKTKDFPEQYIKLKLEEEHFFKVIDIKDDEIFVEKVFLDEDKIKEYNVKGFPTLVYEKNGEQNNFVHRDYDNIVKELKKLTA